MNFWASYFSGLSDWLLCTIPEDTFARMNQIGSFYWQQGWFGACYYGNEFITSVVPSWFSGCMATFAILLWISPQRGARMKIESLGMESQGSVIVRNIWQVSLLQVSASHSCLFVSFVVKCAKLSTSLSLLTLPRQNSLSKRLYYYYFFF